MLPSRKLHDLLSLCNIRFICLPEECDLDAYVLEKNPGVSSSVLGPGEAELGEQGPGGPRYKKTHSHSAYSPWKSTPG